MTISNHRNKKRKWSSRLLVHQEKEFMLNTQTSSLSLIKPLATIQYPSGSNARLQLILFALHCQANILIQNGVKACMLDCIQFKPSKYSSYLVFILGISPITQLSTLTQQCQNKTNRNKNIFQKYVTTLTTKSICRQLEQLVNQITGK